MCQKNKNVAIMERECSIISNKRKKRGNKLFFKFICLVNFVKFHPNLLKILKNLRKKETRRALLKFPVL